MKAFSADGYSLPLPPGHRFPIVKYARLRARLLDEGVLSSQDLLVSEPASDEQLLLVHQPSYLQRVIDGSLNDKENRRIGIPWSPEMVERSRRSVGGTIAACRAALADGIAAHMAGGTHHAYPDHGEGFCVFNDVAVAIRVMQNESRADRAVVLDCDVHQGNGTAAIFKEDDRVFTFSIHGEKNFPFHKEESDLDVALPDGCRDDQYLDALQSGVIQALDRAGADFAVYLAGADPFEGDLLGRLGLSKAGLAERDRLVFSRCKEAGLPIAVVLAGGYGKDIEDTVDIYFQTVRLAAVLDN